MLERKFIKRFEDCVLVEGYSRCAIYDFSRKRHTIIDKQQATWFRDIDHKPFDIVQREAKEYSHYAKFLKFLFDNEFIFTCTQSELAFFPPLKEEWHNPSRINNLLMLRNEESSDKIFERFRELEKLGLKHVQLFLERGFDFLYVKNLIEGFSEISIHSIEVFSQEDLSAEFIKNASILSDSQLVTLSITDKDEFKMIRKNDELPFNIVFLKNAFQELFENNPPDPNYFTVDIRLYMESLSYNTFFNKKLIINAQDQILSHWGGSSLATLGDILINDLIETTGFFTKFWNITKADLKICRDCEYRHMCVDSRIPQITDNEWFFVTECNYDPYSGKWAWEKEMVKENL